MGIHGELARMRRAEPMRTLLIIDKRLAEIRTSIVPEHGCIAGELLAEVDRLRAMETELYHAAQDCQCTFKTKDEQMKWMRLRDKALGLCWPPE